MFTEEIAKVFTQSYVIDMDNVHDIDEESRHDDFLTTSEVYKNKKREYIWSVFNIFGCWSKNIPTKFWMWDVLIFDHHHGRDQSMMKQQPNGRRRLLRHQCPRYWSRSCASLGLVGSEGAWAGSGSASSARGRTRGEGAWDFSTPSMLRTPIWERVQGQKSFTRSQGTSSKSWRVPNGSGTPWAWCRGGGAPLWESTQPEEQPSKALSPFNALRVPAPRVGFRLRDSVRILACLGRVPHCLVESLAAGGVYETAAVIKIFAAATASGVAIRSRSVWGDDVFEVCKGTT